MSRERTCPAAYTAKGLALLRLCVARHFLGCRRSEPPGGRCNRRAKCRYGNINYGREYSGQLGCRGSEPARQPSRLKGLPCYGPISLGIFSDGRKAPPGDRCNRKAKCHYCKIWRLPEGSRRCGQFGEVISPGCRERSPVHRGRCHGRCTLNEWRCGTERQSD